MSRACPSPCGGCWRWRSSSYPGSSPVRAWKKKKEKTRSPARSPAPSLPCSSFAHAPASSHPPPSTGMTLGIMGLDKVGLQIVATAGDTEKERRHAREFFCGGASRFRDGAGERDWGGAWPGRPGCAGGPPAPMRAPVGQVGRVSGLLSAPGKAASGRGGRARAPGPASFFPRRHRERPPPGARSPPRLGDHTQHTPSPPQTHPPPHLSLPPSPPSPPQAPSSPSGRRATG
jgi:hypothetical protein